MLLDIEEGEGTAGKHKGYIDANNGLAGGIYIAEKAIPVKLGRKAFCSRPWCFLNIVEINQLSLNPSHETRASGSNREERERPSAKRTVELWVHRGWENAPAGGCKSGVA